MPGLSCSRQDLLWILSCGMWDLLPWRGIEPGPPGLGVWILSHWTTRELPRGNNFNCSEYLYRLRFCTSQLTRLLFPPPSPSFKRDPRNHRLRWLPFRVGVRQSSLQEPLWWGSWLCSHLHQDFWSTYTVRMFLNLIIQTNIYINKPCLLS